MNYPLIKCIENIGYENIHHIFGVLLLYQENLRENITYISEISNFFDYVMVVIQRFLQSRFFMTDISCKIPYEIRMSSPEFTLDDINKCIYFSEHRRSIIQEGREKMCEWIKN
jgi:hypothetical protein